MSPLALALLMPCLAGIAIARRLFSLNHWIYFVPVGLTTVSLLTAMSVNLILRAGGSLTLAMGGSVGLMGLLGALSLLGSRRGSEDVRISPWAYLYLAAMTLLVYFSCVSYLFLNPDDDFWVHAPMQAQLLKGNFPIKNPVFSELAYGGHYARDLCMVIFAWFTGINLYAVQAPVTAFFQVNAFWLVFAGALRYGRSQGAAVLCSLFVFMGVNAAGRGGWIDTVGNNNAVAHVHTALLLFLFLKVLFEEVSRSQVVGTAVLFAGLSWSYETSFVGLGFALVFFALMVAVKREIERKQLLKTAAIIVVCIFFLILQGGAFGELFTRLLSSGSSSKVEVDVTTQAQSQQVSVKFPKDELFKIKLERAGDEVSIAYHTFPWLQAFDRTPREPGYVSVFSPLVWRIHWLSLYLSPLVLLVLWRLNNRYGLLLWSWGFVSYFIPAVVDFGIFEVEVFRWEYAASWGFAGALGVALGKWLGSARGPIFSMDRETVTLSRNCWKWVVAAALVFLNCYPSWVQLEKRARELPSLKYGFLLPSAETWMAFHPVLGISQTDLEVGMKLGKLVGKNEQFLMSRRAESPEQILQESAFVGLVGGQTVGHAFPLLVARVGTKPFRQSAPAIAFWATGDPDLLRNWDLRWLYVKDGPDMPEIPETDGLELALSEGGGTGERRAYRVSLSAFPEVDWSLAPHPRISLGEIAPLEDLGTEEYRELSFEGDVTSEDLLLTYRFFDAGSGELVTYEEGFTQTLKPGGFHFVGPHNPGEYQVKLFAGEGESQSLVGEFRCVTHQLEAFQELEVGWSGETGPLHGGLLQTVELEFRNPTEVELKLRGRLGLTGEIEGQFVPRDFQELDLVLPPKEGKVLSLKVVPPKLGGEIPFELVLNPKDGLRYFKLEPRTVIY